MKPFTRAGVQGIGIAMLSYITKPCQFSLHIPQSQTKAALREPLQGASAYCKQYWYHDCFFFFIFHSHCRNVEEKLRKRGIP
jgi:hypothetical protein